MYGAFLVDDGFSTISLRAGYAMTVRSRPPILRALGRARAVGLVHRERPAARLAEDDTDLLLRGDSESPRGVRTEVVLPLRDQGRAIGALVLQDQDPGAFGEDTLSALQEMADQLGGAIGVARAFVEAEGALRSTREALGQIGRDSALRALPGEVSATGGCRTERWSRQGRLGGRRCPSCC